MPELDEMLASDDEAGGTVVVSGCTVTAGVTVVSVVIGETGETGLAFVVLIDPVNVSSAEVFPLHNSSGAS